MQKHDRQIISVGIQYVAGNIMVADRCPIEEAMVAGH